MGPFLSIYHTFPSLFIILLYFRVVVSYLPPSSSCTFPPFPCHLYLCCVSSTDRTMPSQRKSDSFLLFCIFLTFYVCRARYHSKTDARPSQCLPPFFIINFYPRPRPFTLIFSRSFCSHLVGSNPPNSLYLVIICSYL